MPYGGTMALRQCWAFGMLDATHSYATLQPRERRMEFNVVSIPREDTGKIWSPVIKSLTDNIGKAIEISVGEKDPNDVRKNVRSGLIARGLLATYRFNSKSDKERKTLTMWLTPKQTGDRE